MSDYVYGQPGATDDSNPYGKPEQKPSGALRDLGKSLKVGVQKLPGSSQAHR